MNNRFDKWRSLQDHETPPPADAYDRLRRRLFLVTEAGSDLTRSHLLHRLREHSVTPPPFLCSAIKNKVLEQGRPNRLFTQRGRIITAAACLLLIVSGIFLFRSGNHPPVQPVVAARGKNPVPPGVTQTAKADSTVTAAVAPTQPPPLAATGTTGSSSHIAPPHLNPGIGGHHIVLLDNDLLFTFTSFRYPELYDCIDQDDSHNLRIYVDQYANIMLSPTMSGFIRDMYRFRKNGQATRKARKTKEKLEKWRTLDQKRFDSGDRANPLDPLDLGEFLFR